MSAHPRCEAVLWLPGAGGCVPGSPNLAEIDRKNGAVYYRKMAVATERGESEKVYACAAHRKEKRAQDKAGGAEARSLQRAALRKAKTENDVATAQIREYLADPPPDQRVRDRVDRLAEEFERAQDRVRLLERLLPRVNGDRPVVVAEIEAARRLRETWRDQIDAELPEARSLCVCDDPVPYRRGRKGPSEWCVKCQRLHRRKQVKQ